MASVYSTSLKIELIGTGDQTGLWGGTTNTNLGTALEQAIVGKATLVTGDFTANVATLTLLDSNASQTARAFVLDVTATLSAAGTINVPAVQKPYIVFNNSVGGFAVTIKVSGQPGVSVPNGKRALVYNTGTDVIDGINYVNGTVATATAATSLSGGSAGVVPFQSGVGATSFTAVGTSGLPLLSAGAGTPTWSTLNLTSGVTGTLPIANGGTNSTATATAGGIGYGTGTANAYTAAGTTGQVLTSAGAGVPAWVTALPVANGGTGATTLASNNVLLGNGTSALQVVAPGTSGNVLTSNGTTWSSTAVAGSGLKLLATVTPTAAANVDFLSTFSSTYDNYLIIVDGVRSSASGSSYLYMRVAQSGAAVASNVYYWAASVNNSSFSTVYDYFWASTNIDYNSTIGGNLNITVNNANTTTEIKSIDSYCITQTNSLDTFTSSRQVCALSAGAVLTGVRFYWSNGGNFQTTGKIRVYGYSNT